MIKNSDICMPGFYILDNKLINRKWTMHHISFSLRNILCIQSSYIANSTLYAFAIFCLFKFGPKILLNEAYCAFSTWKLNLRSFRYQRPQTHIFLTTKTKDQWLHLSRKMKLQNLFPPVIWLGNQTITWFE